MYYKLATQCLTHLHGGVIKCTLCMSCRYFLYLLACELVALWNTFVIQNYICRSYNACVSYSREQQVKAMMCRADI